MRKLLAVLFAMALVAAACNGSSGSDTTAADEGTTSPDDAEEVFLGCTSPTSGLASDGVMCADYTQGLFSELVEDAKQDPTIIGVFGGPENGAFVIDGQQCLTTGELLVYPAYDDVPAFLVESEPPEGLAEYLDAIQLGVYRPTGDEPEDLFGAILEAEAEGKLASPHYLLGPTQGWKYGPASIAEPFGVDWEDLPDRQMLDDEMSDGRVIVVDTGGVPDDPSDSKRPALGVSKAEAEQGVGVDVAGHGQFIASIINRYNPRLNVEIYAASRGEAGAASELGVVEAIRRAGEIGGSVVNISLGTYACSVDDPPLGLAAGLTLLPQEVLVDDGVAIDVTTLDVRFAAASGNEEKGHPPMYPALLSTVPIEDIFYLGDGEFERLVSELGGEAAAAVIAVGASDQSGDQAEFSNNADVYVPGVDVVGWYEPAGSLAVWSGTSFAAPRYAACMASGICPPPGS